MITVTEAREKFGDSFKHLIIKIEKYDLSDKTKINAIDRDFNIYKQALKDHGILQEDY